MCINNNQVEFQSELVKLILVFAILVLGGLGSSGAVSSSSGTNQSIDESVEQGPSFDCKKASTKVEVAICNSSKLSNLDRKMARIYQKTINLPERKKDIKESQLYWLKSMRRKCETLDNVIGNSESRDKCIFSAYMDRIKQIKKQEICIAFSSLIDKEGFDALSDVEQLKGNDAGIIVPNFERVTNKKIKKMPIKMHEWMLKKRGRDSAEEIERSSKMFWEWVVRDGLALYTGKIDYDNDGNIESVISLRPVIGTLPVSEFSGYYYVFDEKYKIIDNPFFMGRHFGWIVTFLDETYSYVPKHDLRSGTRSVTVYHIMETYDKSLSEHNKVSKVQVQMCSLEV